METAGTVAKQAFGNDGLGMIQTAAGAAAKGLSAIPVVGGLAASAIEALIAPVGLLQAAMGAATGRAKELAQYSGEIAIAQSQAETMQMFADMKEANQQGSRYAALLLREQEMNQSFQEALAPLKAILVNTLVDVAELVKMFVESLGIGKNMELGMISLVEMTPFIGDGIVKLLKVNREIRDLLKKDDEPLDGVGDIRRMIDGLQIPGGAAGEAAGAAAEFMRQNEVPVMLK